MMEAVNGDWRNNGLTPFDQSFKYRHELCQVSDNGSLIDYWQAPFQTYDWSIGDCEDLSMYFCKSPPIARKNGKRYKFEPATYRSGPNMIHTVVAVHGLKQTWQCKPDIKLYVPSGDRYISQNDYDIGLIDPSWICGMPHPYGYKMKGHCADNPKYFVGASRCTTNSDLHDRLNVTHRMAQRFIDG